jgi:hypothetical protein
MKDEDIKFIATIFAAARKLGIGARADLTMGRFEWSDPAVGGWVRLQTPDPDPKELLLAAANALRSYWTIQQQKDGT